MGLLALASLILMYEFRMRMQAALLYTAQTLSQETSDGHNVALSDVRESVLKYFGEKEDYRFVVNGSDGIDLTKSFLDNPEYVELRASYNLTSVIDMFGLLSIPINDRCVLHSCCGYINGYANDEGIYVYITKDSEVYHVDRECSYLRPDIIETTGKLVGKQRNEKGGKYYRCEYCKAKKKDGVLYVTSDGDRFHNSLSCPGLKRTVRSIQLEEAVERGLRSCSKCGR